MNSNELDHVRMIGIWMSYLKPWETSQASILIDFLRESGNWRTRLINLEFEKGLHIPSYIKREVSSEYETEMKSN